FGRHPLGDAAPSPQNLERQCREAISREGLFKGLFIGTELFVPLKISEFKLGSKQKVGNRQAQPVEYNSTIKDTKKSMTTVVWIDIETKLPLRREFRMKEGGMEGALIETFTDVKLDGKIDPKKFELPKNAR